MGRMIITGRMIIRPYGHHQKPLVRLFGGLKSVLQNGFGIIRIIKRYGNAINMNILFVMNNRIKPFLNTSSTIPKNGKTTNFINNDIQFGIART